MIGLVGVPYNEMNCWQLVEKYLGVEVAVPEDILISPRAQVVFRDDMKHQFVEINAKELRDGDVILHGTHIALYLDNAAANGILHSIDPYSEFIPCTKWEARTGLNNKIDQNFGRPAFYRLIGA